MKITEDVYALEATRGNYAYLIRQPTAMLVDTGHPGQGRAILSELDSLNVAPQDVRHILLTHHDIDHTGNVAFLQQATGAQVWVSSIDLLYVLGQKPRTGIKQVAAWLMPADAPAQISAFPPENELEEIKIVATPGHTPGHVCLLYKDVLFAGDLVVCFNGKLRLSPSFMTWNMHRLKESVRQVADLPFRWICPAHGAPMERDGAWEKLYEA